MGCRRVRTELRALHLRRTARSARQDPGPGTAGPGLRRPVLPTGLDEGDDQHLHGVADLQVGQVLGDVTLRVSLDEQVEVAGFIVGGDGGVRADDLLGLAFDCSSEGNVLADGEAEDVGGAGESEAVDCDVVGDFVLFLEEEVLKFGGVEDLSSL